MDEEKAKEYKIIIETKEEEQKQPTEPDEQPEVPIAEKLTKPKKSIIGLAAFSVATGVAKQSFDWATTIVGRNSGNSIVQSRINTTISLATKGAVLGGALLGSAATGNIAGLIASFGGIVMEGISMAREIEQKSYELRWTNTDLLLQRERGGSAYNRSRI